MCIGERRIIKHVDWGHGSNNKDHSGVTTVVADFDGKGNVWVGLAFCSPKDGFSRKKGLALALDRLNKMPIKAKVLMDDLEAIGSIFKALGLGYTERLELNGNGGVHWEHIIPMWFKIKVMEINRTFK